MDIEKHLIITGSSEVSWKDAIVKAISEASKSIDYLSGVKILEQRANIDGNKISARDQIKALELMGKRHDLFSSDTKIEMVPVIITGEREIHE